MNREQYFEFHRAFCDKMIDVTRMKNMDYAGNSENPFSNFTVVEQTEVCSTLTGFLVRMSDKMSRIKSIVNSGKTHVKDESIQDTLHDLANYCALMSGYIESLKGKPVEPLKP